MDRCSAELDCSETGCQTLLGIETACVQALKLWLMTLHLFIFMIYLMIQVLGRTVQVGLLGLLVNRELDRTGRKRSLPDFIAVLSFTRTH